MQLHRYLTRLHTIIDSRHEIEIEYLHIDETIPGREAIIEGRLRFWDQSLLEFAEVLVIRGLILVKTDYTYHYQDNRAHLVFRYDNAPHHPEVSTHPHHKHVIDPITEAAAVMDAASPDLSDVLREIDRRLYD